MHRYELKSEGRATKYWKMKSHGMAQNSRAERGHGTASQRTGMLRKVPNTKSSKIKAYKKEIDGLIFVKERQIPIHFDGEIGNCERPLRGQTPQGERVALANSESIPAGAWIEFTVQCLTDGLAGAVTEWLDYGMLRGPGQWRNSGKGRFQ